MNQSITSTAPDFAHWRLGAEQLIQLQCSSLSQFECLRRELSSKQQKKIDAKSIKKLVGNGHGNSLVSGFNIFLVACQWTKKIILKGIPAAVNLKCPFLEATFEPDISCMKLPRSNFSE